PHNLIVFFLTLFVFLRFAYVTFGVIQAMLITKTEGEDFRDSFKVDQVGNSRLYLCKNNCSKEDILIETSGNRAQSGRYTVRYDGELYVTITELTQSDSGQYSFGVSNSSVLGSYKTFELRITVKKHFLQGQGGFRKCSDLLLNPLILPESIFTLVSLWSLLTHTQSPVCSVLPLVVSLIVIVLLAAFLLLLYKWKIGTKCNCESPYYFICCHFNTERKKTPL
uniref:Immunoglobulin V-set domain-containing protein n=1 Tax=Anabas testudineus TaxID=64144 RepID=A0A3Q1JR87_ANATE